MTAALSEADGANAKLAVALASSRVPVFAVVDGGHFDDLPAELAGACLLARSLFLDSTDAEAQRSGPWLVDLSQSERAVPDLLALFGERCPAVFWSTETGEAVLWRHLRTLNKALIPQWAADGGEAPPPEEGPEPADEAVLFRHWDPAVLAGLMPALDPAQFARVVGPASQIIIYASDYGGLQRVPYDPAWPPAPPGMLTIRSEQIAALADARVGASRRRTMAYMRKVAPRETGGASDEEVYAHVLMSEETGRVLGIASEAGHCRWAYLMMATEGRVAASPEVAGYVRTAGASPDERVKEIMKSTIMALKDARLRESWT